VLLAVRHLVRADAATLAAATRAAAAALAATYRDAGLSFVERIGALSSRMRAINVSAAGAPVVDVPVAARPIVYTLVGVLLLLLRVWLRLRAATRGASDGAKAAKNGGANGAARTADDDWEGEYDNDE
jgi:hypothetical protein